MVSAFNVFSQVGGYFARREGFTLYLNMMAVDNVTPIMRKIAKETKAFEVAQAESMVSARMAGVLVARRNEIAKSYGLSPSEFTAVMAMSPMARKNFMKAKMFAYDSEISAMAGKKMYQVTPSGAAMIAAAGGTPGAFYTQEKMMAAMTMSFVTMSKAGKAATKTVAELESSLRFFTVAAATSAKQIGLTALKRTAGFGLLGGGLMAGGALAGLANSMGYEKAVMNALALSGEMGNRDAVMKQLQGYALQYPSKPEDIAEAYRFVATTGLTGSTAMAAMSSGLAVANANGEDLVQTIQDLIMVYQQFNGQGLGFTKLADAMQYVLSKTMLTADQLQESMRYAGTAGAVLGTDFYGMLASIGAVSQVGLVGGMSGRGAIQALLNMEMKKEDFTDALAILGVDPSTVYNADGSLNMIGLAQAIGAGGKNESSSEVVSALGNSRVGPYVRFLLALGQQSGTASSLYGGLKSGESTGEVQRVLDEQKGSLWWTMGIASNALQQTFLDPKYIRALNETFQPFVDTLVNELGPFIKDFLFKSIYWFRDNSQTILDTIKSLTTMLTGLTEVAVALWKYGLAPILDAFNGLPDWAKKFTAFALLVTYLAGGFRQLGIAIYTASKAMALYAATSQVAGISGGGNAALGVLNPMGAMYMSGGAAANVSYDMFTGQPISPAAGVANTAKVMRGGLGLGILGGSSYLGYNFGKSGYGWGYGIGSTLGSAAGGAMIGSAIMPGYGTAIGAVIGGGIGLGSYIAGRSRYDTGAESQTPTIIYNYNNQTFNNMGSDTSTGLTYASNGSWG